MLKPYVPFSKTNAMTALAFLEQGEQQSQRGWQVFFDLRRDDLPDRRLGLDLLDPIVERCEHDGDLRRRCPQRLDELFGGVERIERKNRRAGFPGADLGDQKLRTIRQHERDAVAAA